MRRFLLLLFGAGVLLAASACGSDGDRSSPPARQAESSRSGTSYETDPVPAPDLTLKTMDGRTINLARQTGKVVLVNFWATWCGPCRREIPDLVNLYTELKDEGLVIVGIAVDREGAEVVKPFVQEREINYPIVLDPDQSIESHFDAMYGLPTTYLVNPDGKIVRRILGVFPIEEMKPRLQEMLQAKTET
jgi:peroxiredoxin